VKFHAIDVWRWQQLDIDASELDHPEDVIDAARQAIEKALKDADERSLAIRIVVKGQTTTDRNLRNCKNQWKDELHRMAVDVFEDRVWIEKFRIETSYPKALNDEERDEAYGELVASIYGVVPDEDVFADVRNDIEKVLKQIPGDSRLQDLQLDLEDETTMTRLVEDAKQLLAARLLDSTEPTERGVA
jgi:hypothetical protein